MDVTAALTFQEEKREKKKKKEEKRRGEETKERERKEDCMAISSRCSINAPQIHETNSTHLFRVRC